MSDPVPAVQPQAITSTVERLRKVPLQHAELLAPIQTVFVSGCTGYIASAIVERLLRRGHTVHATCRDPSKLDALQPLLALPGAAERLKLFKADLSVSGSFDAAMEGCSVAFHVAAPVHLNRIPPGEERRVMIDPMLAGVDNVLGAANRTPTVRRVVMTSSISALNTSAGDKPGGKFDENDWNHTASETNVPYAYGKRLSEQRAWELAKAQSRWTLVTVLPSVVFGPTAGVCPNSESVQAITELLWPGLMWPAAGAMGVPVVDARDVAVIHTLAAFTPKAHGRYIAHAEGTSMRAVTYMVARRFPANVWPSHLTAPYWLVWAVAPLLKLRRDVVRAMWGPPPQYDTSRTESDLAPPPWLPLEATMIDMILDCADKGMIKLKQKMP
ncbi:hypothetical protein HYH03_008447 [Edaphochlamys debaryana]|uniref:NAD-dependent epimerase/dehydratase domain-containing protein n=1 Tax=Edaphochlamys debaryana TaxID=47281 RepID=A0A835Y142_9CHLO|nr:hypothetical protein HYH03_008447 [Edaphochlamys debaryana]|eukprot:KAG2493312.1 hypothetical protein HYH03_008447 [Edaphochlamys debaryana]